MPGTIERNSSNLHDAETGVMTGYKNPITGKEVALDSAAVQALVSVDGNLATADVATATGAPGELRKLSDGPDKGAVLVWSIPENGVAYAWCWQIYPLAAYL